MISRQMDQEALDSLWKERFVDLPLDCGQDAQPGTDEVEEWRDWTDRPTTEDQIRIENVLSERVSRRCSILHVGVGNSGLAGRFSHRVREIVGTTISPAENRHASQTGLSNYKCHLNNKYSGIHVPGPVGFDYIVDNNPTAFGCCRKHFVLMMGQYRERLAPEGMVLTDRKGLGWVSSAPGANPRWAFSFEDWEAAGRLFGLRAVRLNEYVFALLPQAAVLRSPPLLRRVRRGLARRINALRGR